MDNNVIEQLITAFENDNKVNSTITCSEFQEVYYRVARSPKGSTVWVMVFIEDQVWVQPITHRNFFLVICDHSKFYTKHDFNFMNLDDVAYYGTHEGPYTFWLFIKDIFTKVLISIIGVCTTVLVALFYGWIGPLVIQTVSLALIQAISVFIAIFVLQFISIDPAKHFRFIETARYYRLAQTDKYIALIGIGSLIVAILSVILSSNYPYVVPNIGIWNTKRFIQSGLAALSCMGVLISLWLVLDYHFNRQRQLVQMSMAPNVIDNQRRLFEQEIDEQSN